MIDMSKKYQTRSGEAVRILCIDGPDPVYPVIALVKDKFNALKFCPDGGFNRNMTHHWDLVEIKPKIRVKGKIVGYTRPDCLVWAEVFTLTSSGAMVNSSNGDMDTRCRALKRQGYTLAIEDIDMEIDQE